jgi:hypothetical protein
MAAKPKPRAAAKSAPAQSVVRAAVTPTGRRRLLRRFATGAKIAAVLLAGTLAVGVLGYHYIAKLDWLIGFHQASLLLSGMGPVVSDLSDAGRVFESLYSLFCGVMLLGSTGILFTPFIHHLLHKFHVEDSGDAK